MKVKELNNKMSASFIIKAFIKNSMVRKKQNRYFYNVYIGHWEADILEVTKSEYTYEYEVKISRADFKNDGLKARRYWSKDAGVLKHDILQQGKRTNYFYFVVPEGLVQATEVPEWAGLIYCKRRIEYDMFDQVSRIHTIFVEVKKAKQLHKEKISSKKLIKLYESIYFKHYNKL